MNTGLRSLSITAALVALPATALPGSASADEVPLVPSIGGFHEGLYVPFNDAPLGGLGDAQVLANGNLSLSWAGSDFGGEVDQHGNLDEFDSGVNLRGAATVELAVDAGGDLSGSLPLATVPLGSYPVAPEVSVQPFVSIRLRLSGSADAGARVSVVAPFDLATAFSEVGQSTTSPPRFKPQFGGPDAAGAVGFDGTIELEFSVTFLVTIANFPVGGPVLKASLGMELLVDPTLVDEPWWDLNGIATIEGGWALPLPEGAEIPELRDPLVRIGPVRRWNIADAGNDPPAGADTSTRWSRAFDIGNNDTVIDVLPTDDGFVVADDGNYPWLAELDGLGNPTLQTESDQGRTARAMAYAGNGDVLVVGVPSLVRYTPDGFPLWARTFEVSTADTTTWTAILPEGDGAIIGGYSTDNSVARPAFAEVDQDGNVVWSTEIDTGPNSTNGEVWALAAQGEEILAVGSVDYEDPNTNDYWADALVLRLADDGAALGATAIGTDTGDEYADAIAVRRDGSYAISGRGHGAASDPSWVVSFSANHTVRWSSTYADRPDEGVGEATGIAAPSAGGYVISGTVGAGDGMDAWLIWVDPEGMPLWSTSYNGPERDHLEGSAPWTTVSSPSAGPRAPTTTGSPTRTPGSCGPASTGCSPSSRPPASTRRTKPCSGAGSTTRALSSPRRTLTSISTSAPQRRPTAPPVRSTSH